MLFLCAPQSTVRQAACLSSHTFSGQRLKRLWESLLLCNSSGIISTNPTPGPRPGGRAMPAASACPRPSRAGWQHRAGGGVPGTGAGQAARHSQKGPGGAGILVWSYGGCWVLLPLLQAHSRAGQPDMQQMALHQIKLTCQRPGVALTDESGCPGASLSLQECRAVHPAAAIQTPITLPYLWKCSRSG